MSKYKIYASDTRKSTKTILVKETEDFFKATEFFIDVVWKFKCHHHTGEILENTHQRFTFEFTNGEMVDLIMITE